MSTFDGDCGDHPRPQGTGTPAGYPTSTRTLSVPACRALRRACEPEALGFLQITLAAQQKMPWTGGFAVAA